MTAPATDARDLVDAVVGIAPGDTLDSVRRGREQSRTHTQASFDALYTPLSEAGFSASERHAVGSFVVALHETGETGATDAPARLQAALGDELRSRDAALAEAVAELARAARRPGPYGVYREPGLAAESESGPVWVATASGAVDAHLAAALTHAALLVLRPRESSPQALDALLAAGWDTASVVTLSQLVAFTSYLVRLVQGLGVLAATPVPAPEDTAAPEETS